MSNAASPSAARPCELLPETDTTASERASARAHASLTYQVTGDVHAADERSLEEAVEAFSAMGALVPLLNGINRLGRFRMMQGRLRAAFATYQRPPTPCRTAMDCRKR